MMIEKDFEGCNRSLIELISRNLLGMTEIKKEKLWSDIDSSASLQIYL
jgi:hypothetical protein